MQKVKDGYRASVRLNMGNPEHEELYRMFTELLNTGAFSSESAVFREGIKCLYEQRVGQNSAKLEANCMQCADNIVQLVSDTIEALLADKLIASVTQVEEVTHVESKSKENSIPEETMELPTGICDFLDVM